MSRLLAIEVRGFRGLKEFSCDLPGARHLLLCGSNGTGKSSLFQALAFGATGTFLPVSSVSAEPERYRHKDLEAADVAEVFLRFAGPSGERRIRRYLHHHGQVTRDLEPTDADAPEEAHEVCFLNRQVFSEMVDAADRTCWERLTPFLGHGELAAFRGGLKGLVQQFRKDTDVAKMEARKKELDREISRLDDEALVHSREAGLCNPATPPEVLSALSSLTNLAPLPVDPAGNPDWSFLEKAVPGNAELRQVEGLRSNLRLELQARVPREPTPGDLEQALEVVRTLQKESTLLHDLVHARLLEAAQVNVAELSEGPCPVCGLWPRDWAAVRRNLAGRLDQLRPLTRRLATAREFLARTQGQTRECLLALERLPREVPEREARTILHQGLRSYQDWLDSLVEGLGETPPRGFDEGDLEAVLAARDAVQKASRVLSEELRVEGEALDARAEELGASQDLRRFHALKDLHRVLVGRQVKESDRLLLSRRLEETERISSALSQLNREVDQAEAALGHGLLTALEKDTSRIFKSITRSDALKPVLRSSGSSGIRKADIMIEDFHGRGEVRARDYLSEANRNALGLSLYFAGLLRLDPGLKVMVLDDITHSADNVHRSGLASFLAEELGQKMQLVVLTHDDNWFEQLGALLPDSETRRMRVLSWNIWGVQLKDDSFRTLLARAEEAIRSHQGSGGNLLRQAVEEFVDEICTAYRVKVRFCRRPAELKLGEKLEALRERVRELHQQGTGLVDPEAFSLRTISQAQRITNEASHARGRSETSHQDLLDALGEVKAFVATFQCKRRNQKGAACGQLLPGLEKKGGRVPECKGCHQPVVP